MSIGAAPNVAGGLIVGDPCVNCGGDTCCSDGNCCGQDGGANASLPAQAQLIVCDPCQGAANSCQCPSLLLDVQCCTNPPCPPPPGPYNNLVHVFDFVTTYEYERVPITCTRPDGTSETKNAECGGVLFYAPVMGTYTYTTPEYKALNCTVVGTPNITGSQATGTNFGGVSIYVTQIP